MNRKLVLYEKESEAKNRKNSFLKNENEKFYNDLGYLEDLLDDERKTKAGLNNEKNSLSDQLMMYKKLATERLSKIEVIKKDYNK